MTIEEIHDLCQIDMWFLRHIEEMVATEKALREFSNIKDCPD